MRSNYVNEPTRYWKADASAWYLKGIFLIHTTGKLYKDSGNPAHYRIACSIYVQHVFNRIGGYWKGNSGDGVTVEFNGNQIFQSQISTPLSCWNNNSYSDNNVKCDISVLQPGKSHPMMMIIVRICIII